MMKILKKILIAGVIIFAVIFIGTYAFILLQGKAIITQQLENLTHRKVKMGYVGLTLPLNLGIRNLDIEGLAKIDYISASVSLQGLFTGKMLLNELKIIRPEIIYEKKAAKGAQAPPKEVAVFIPVVLTTTQPAAKQLKPLAFKHLIIKDGKINFRDYTVGSEGIKITVQDLDLNLTNLYLYPNSVNTNFILKAKVPWQEGQEEGKIELEGWLNLFKRDIQATLKLADIDGVYLYPYYSEWVDLGDMRIEKAKLNVTTDIKGTEGNIIFQHHLELTDMVFKKPQLAEGNKTEEIISTVMDVFSILTKTNKVIFNFATKGKMPSFY